MTTGNIDKLKQIFMEVFSISEAEVESYRKLNSMKWDSVATVTLIVAIETEFNIKLQESDFESLISFSDAEQVLEKYKS